MMLRGILLVLLAGVLGCGRAGEQAPGKNAPTTSDAVSFRNVATGTSYVGDAACFSCHEDEYRGYQAHGMARSFYRLTAENRVEAPLDTALYHASSGFYYTVRAEQDGWYQEEFMRSVDGQTTHRLRRRMDYVVGSGNAARTYLTQSNGRLYELPLTWYTQKKRWDFSPGYEVVNGRFDRLIPDRCMACHNSYPEATPFVEGKYAAVPEGIGCERCHGPGDLHVNERLANPEPSGEVDDTIVNPAHLSFERRLDVCQQCHLSATVSLLREGRSAFDFEPSEALSDHLSLFATHEKDASGEHIDVISHADRMRQSACFLATRDAAKPLECITCHNPHGGFRDKGPAYFNQTCRTCHDAKALQAGVAADARDDHVETSDCFGCHMPKVQAGDAPHASFTDHWIRVVGAGTVIDAPALPAGELLETYFERDKGNREGQLYLGMGLIVYGRQRNDPRIMATGAATLEKALEADTTHGEAHFLLGVAYQQLGNVDRAIPPLERALRIRADIPEWLNGLAQAYEAARRDSAVIGRLYRRALDLQPAQAGIRVNYAHFLQSQGRTAEAVRTYQTARSEQPWFDLAALYLGTALVELDRMQEAEQAFAEALQLNPQYASVLGNLLLVQTTHLPPSPRSEQGGEVVQEASTFSPVAAPSIALEQAEDEIRILPVRYGETVADERSGARGVVRFDNLPRRATVRIFTQGGTPLRTLEKDSASPLLSWDLHAEDGFPLASGLYLVHVRARDEMGRTLWTRLQKFAMIRKHAAREEP